MSGATGNPRWHEGPIAQNPSNTARRNPKPDKHHVESRENLVEISEESRYILSINNSGDEFSIDNWGDKFPRLYNLQQFGEPRGQTDLEFLVGKILNRSDPKDTGATRPFPGRRRAGRGLVPDVHVSNL